MNGRGRQPSGRGEVGRDRLAHDDRVLEQRAVAHGRALREQRAVAAEDQLVLLILARALDVGDAEAGTADCS